MLLKLKCEVYEILCVVSGKKYVGITTRNVSRRWREHIRNAKLNRRSVLYSAIRKYGVDAFEIEHIASSFSWEGACELERLLIKERRTLHPNGYNMTEGGDGVIGLEYTPEMRANFSKAHKGRKHSEETKELLRRINTGRKMPPEAIEKMASHFRGKKLSIERRKEISECLKKRAPISDETRAKLSAWQLGRKMKPEWVAKSVAAQRGMKKRPSSAEVLEKKRLMLIKRNKSLEMREKVRRASTGKRHSEETKAKLSAMRKGVPMNPQVVAKVAASNTGKKRSLESRLRMKAAQNKRRFLQTFNKAVNEIGVGAC